MKNGRILYLDIARSLSVLWIVGYWHLREYCRVKVAFYGDGHITDVVLGLFMLLSGFFMARYQFADFWPSVWAFYKKRCKRIYILYAISAVTLYLIGFNPGIGCLVTTLTATSAYIPPQPNTLWFIAMLLSFYLLTPFLWHRKTSRSLLRMLGVFVLFFLLRWWQGSVDFRFFWCFPLYCAGLYMGKNEHLMEVLLKDGVAVVSAIALTAILYVFSRASVSLPMQYVILPFGIQLVLYVSRYLALLPVDGLVGKIAYGSMCAYLFHRQVYMLLMWVCAQTGVADIPVWLFFASFLTVCIAVSYTIQYCYDKIIGSRT